MDNGNGLSISDVMALQDRHAGYPYGGYGYGAYPYYRKNNSTANTALGLGVGFGAAALVAAVAVGWGVNAASKARSRAAEQLAAANSTAIDRAVNVGTEATRSLATLIGTERSSRENWQAANQPSITQTLELQNNPSLQSTVQDIVSAMATASAVATANNNGINSAVGGDNFLRVQHYSAPQPCGCGCNG